MAGSADIGYSLMVAAWVLVGLSSGVMFLRLYTRISRLNRVGLDDYLMLASLAAELVHTAFITVGVHWGMGRHITTLSGFQTRLAIKWIFLIQFWAIITCMLGRISFASFLLGILGPAKRLQRRWLWTIIITQLVVTFITIIQIYTQCGSQIQALWDSSVAAVASCQSPDVQTIIGFVQSAINSACDFALTILPLFIVLRLQLPRSTKWGLGAVLCLSVFALVASIVKCIEIRNLGARGDFTWNFVKLTLWVIIENNVVIIAASIPTLRPLMKKAGPLTRHSSGHGNSSRSEKNSRGSNPECAPDNASRRSERPDSHMNSAHTAVAADCNSEEYMLHSMRLGDQITKTTDVRIAYGNTEKAFSMENSGDPLSERPDYLCLDP